jgi:hypothetical protein
MDLGLDLVDLGLGLGAGLLSLTDFVLIFMREGFGVGLAGVAGVRSAPFLNEALSLPTGSGVSFSDFSWVLVAGAGSSTIGNTATFSVLGVRPNIARNPPLESLR